MTNSTPHNDQQTSTSSTHANPWPLTAPPSGFENAESVTATITRLIDQKHGETSQRLVQYVERHRSWWHRISEVDLETIVSSAGLRAPRGRA